MTHISKRPISGTVKERLDEYMIAFLTEAGSSTRKQIFRELFTKTERLMIAKRLILILLISQENSIYKISATLGMSPSTVARFKHSIDKGGFFRTRQWLGKERIRNEILRYMANLLAVPFEAKRKSLKQILDDMP